MADQTSSAALVALSKRIDDGQPESRDPEAMTWGRLAKITEEAGEVIAAFIGATGQNPRKGVTHTIVDVGDELLDVAITALGAYEHLTQHQGLALQRLDDKIRSVARRAGVLPASRPDAPAPSDEDRECATTANHSMTRPAFDRLRASLAARSSQPAPSVSAEQVDEAWVSTAKKPLPADRLVAFLAALGIEVTP